MHPIPKCASGMVVDVRVLDDAPVKPFESLEGVGRMGLDLAKCMAEHVYVFFCQRALRVSRYAGDDK